MNTKQTENLLVSLAALRAQRDTLLKRIATVTGMLSQSAVGQYKNGTISKVKSAEIQVRAFTRKSYRIVRTK